jgi:hypothetical protein
LYKKTSDSEKITIKKKEVARNVMLRILPLVSNLNKIIKQKLKSNRNENIRKPSTHQVKAVYQI